MDLVGQPGRTVCIALHSTSFYDCGYRTGWTGMSVVGDRMCECRRYECSAAVVTRKDLGQLVVDLRPVRLRGIWPLITIWTMISCKIAAWFIITCIQCPLLLPGLLRPSFPYHLIFDLLPLAGSAHILHTLEWILEPCPPRAPINAIGLSFLIRV